MGWRGRGSGLVRGSLCERCGASRRGRAARHNSATVICANEACRAQICDKHMAWDGLAFLCLPCARERGIDVKKK